MKHLVKLIFKLAGNLLFLLFIYNLVLPLYINGEGRQWYPVLRPDAVEHYQLIFTVLVIFNIVIALLEYFYRNPIWELIEDLPGILTLVMIRDIPKEALNFSQAKVDQIYPIFYVILSILLLLSAIGLVLKIFNFVAIKRETTEQ